EAVGVASAEEGFARADLCRVVTAEHTASREQGGVSLPGDVEPESALAHPARPLDSHLAAADRTGQGRDDRGQRRGAHVTSSPITHAPVASSAPPSSMRMVQPVARRAASVARHASLACRRRCHSDRYTPRTKPSGRPITGSTKKPRTPTTPPTSRVRLGTPAALRYRPA